MSNVEVVHIPENARYEVHVDGEVAGYSEAKDRDDGVVLFSHTVVDDEYEGQGLASQLVAGALDDIRQRGRRIEVTCEYVEDFLEKHAEYQDLVVDTA